VIDVNASVNASEKPESREQTARPLRAAYPAAAFGGV